MIAESDATNLVAELVLNTTGWTDETIDATHTNIVTRWADTGAANEAVRHIVNTWTRSSRPTWAILHGAYNDAVRRRALNRPAISAGPSGRILSPAEGRAIVVQKVAEVRRLRGLPDDHPHAIDIDTILGLIGPS